MEPKPGTIDHDIRELERLRSAVQIAQGEGRFHDAALIKNEVDRYRWKLKNRGWKSPLNIH